MGELWLSLLKVAGLGLPAVVLGVLLLLERRKAAQAQNLVDQMSKNSVVSEAEIRSDTARVQALELARAREIVRMYDEEVEEASKEHDPQAAVDSFNSAVGKLRN